jgi:heme-degrading monooxygenase HmoA
MIARVWRGWTRSEDEDAYTRYVIETGMNASLATEGNRGVRVLRRRADGEHTEFVTITFWESFEAVRRFAGEEPERAVIYPEDERYLLDRELTVAHYEIVDSRSSDRST